MKTFKNRTTTGVFFYFSNFRHRWVQESDESTSSHTNRGKNNWIEKNPVESNRR